MTPWSWACCTASHTRASSSRRAGERPAPEPGVLVQGQAADELHGEERLAVVGQAGLVDLGDAGVVQPAEDLGLMAEALEEGGGGEAGADDLEGDGAARAVLLRLVDGAHAPLAEQAKQTVPAEARRQRRLRRTAATEPRPRASSAAGTEQGAFQEGGRPRPRPAGRRWASSRSTSARSAGSSAQAASSRACCSVGRQVGRLVEQRLNAVVACSLSHPPSVLPDPAALRSPEHAGQPGAGMTPVAVTVLTDRPTTSAVSSTLNPVK